MRTAERETWEESGYRVSIGQLLATVRNGFRIYRRGHCCGWGERTNGLPRPFKEEDCRGPRPKQTFFLSNSFSTAPHLQSLKSLSY